MEEPDRMVLEIKRYHIVVAISCSLLIWGAVNVWFGKEEGINLKVVAPVPPEIKKIVRAPVQINPRPVPPHRITRSPALPFLPLPLKGEGSIKTIALTFDDGPHPVYTEELLNILKEQDVPATFFVVGQQAKRYPELIQKIFEAGHELANHTYSHRDMRTLNASEFESELDKTYEIVEGITEQKMRFFRPPGGQYDQTVVNRGRDLGYEMVLWTALAKDYSNPPARVILNRILRSAGDRGIILLHSGVKNTLSVLPELIRDLRKEGYTFQTLSQMEQSSGQKQLTAGIKFPRARAQ